MLRAARALSRHRAARLGACVSPTSRLRRRALCTPSEPPLSDREIALLRQVSRLEARIHNLEQELPPRVKPARNIDWDNLAFGIMPTNGHVRYRWTAQTSSWDAGRFVTDPYVTTHIHAGVLHYGMTLFEGCKAFRCKDGRVRVCNLAENSARLNRGADRLVMAPVPERLFVEAVDWAVRANAEFVPPYGSGGSLYIRPFLVGTGAILGLQPCPEFTFMVAVTPVGNYFGAGPISGITANVMDFDRAAPRGTGDVKVGTAQHSTA